MKHILLEHTALYLAIGLTLCWLFVVWSATRRWLDADLTPRALGIVRGQMVFVAGVALHFAVVYVVRARDLIDYEHALVPSRVLIALGGVLLVRAVTWPRCGERGWLWLLALCAAIGWAVDSLMS